MSKSAIRYNHDKHTRVERDIDRLHYYEALAVAGSSTIQDKPAREIDSMLQEFGFNLSDKE